MKGTTIFLRKLFFLAAVFVFLFFGGQVLAVECLETGSPAGCTVSIQYTDPGGSGLAQCKYQITSADCSTADPSSWPSAIGECSGNSVTLITNSEQTNTSGNYYVCWYAEDKAENSKRGVLKTIKIISPPVVTTNAATALQPTQAVLNGTLDNLGGDSSADVWFEWGTTVSYGNTTAIQNKTANGAFNATISGLAPGATYHFRAAAVNAVKTNAYGSGLQFAAPNPTFVLKPASVRIGVGNTQQFDGEYDSDGLGGAAPPSIVSRTAVTWSSSNATIAAINNSGLATGAVTGSATVSGVYSGITATANLTVIDLTIPSFSASPGSGSVPLTSGFSVRIGGSANGSINLKFNCDAPNPTTNWQHSFEDPGNSIYLPASDLTPFNQKDAQGHTHSIQRLNNDTIAIYNLCSYLSAGTYTPRVRAERDAANSVEKTTTITVGNLPNVIISSHPGSFTAETTANFVFSSSDSSASFLCKLDGGSWENNCSSPRAYAVSQGVHNFYVKAKNTFGEGPEATWKWTVDATAPVVIKFTADRTVLNITNPKVIFQWEVSDNIGGSGLKQIELWRRAKGENWPDSPLKTITLSGFAASGNFDDTPPGDKIYEYGIHLLDNAGNIGYEPATIFITVDKTAPLIFIYTLADQWYKDNPLLNVDFSDETGLDSGLYQIDSFAGAWTNIFSGNSGVSYTADFQIGGGAWNNLGEGFSHAIYFKTTDDVENITGADGSKSLLVKKDASPPNTAIQCNGVACSVGSYLASVQINLSCSDSYSGCLITYYCQDQTNTCAPGAVYGGVFPVAADGQNYVRFYSRDKVQNQEVIKSQAVKLVLNQPPIISAVSHSPAVVSPFAVSWLGSAVNFSADWSDPDIGDQTKLHVCKTNVISSQTCSGGSWCDTAVFSKTSPTACAYTTTAADTTGAKTYYAFVCDDKNACSASKSGIFLVDAEKPKITAFDVSPKAPVWVSKQSSDITVSWTVSDSGGSHLWYVNVFRRTGAAGGWDRITPPEGALAPLGIPDGPWTGSYIDNPPDGIYYYGFHIIDKAGNDANQGDGGFDTIKVLVDKTAPNSQIQSENPAGPWEKSSQFTIDTLDEDLESGINNNNCGYKVFSYDPNGAEYSYPSAGWANRTCDTSILPITVGPGQMCGYESADSLNYSCYVYLRAFDSAGNEGQTNKGYQIDWTKPQPRKLYIASTEAGQTYPIQVKEGLPYVYKAAVPDNLKTAGCSLYINNIDQGAAALSPAGCSANCSAAKTFTFAGSGVFHNNYIQCRDAAGNIYPATLTERDTIKIDIFVEANRIPTIISGPDYAVSPCASPTTQPGCQINFSISATDADSDSLTYSWDFGDGQSLTQQNPSYHYSTAGNYTAQVVVSDGRGGTVSGSKNIIVTVPTLSVNLTPDPASGVYPLNGVDLTAQVSGTMYGTINYKFDCTNDGVWDYTFNNVADNPKNVVGACNYAVAGNYTAKVSVDRGTGSAQDTANITVSANLPPVASISTDYSLCGPGANTGAAYTKCIFKLNNLSTDPNGLLDIKNSVWTIKEKSTGNIKDTSNCLPGNLLCPWTLLSSIPAGTYVAQLYVEDKSGASGVATKEFTVLQDIIADFVCSLDNINWQKCDDYSKFRPVKGAKVYFKDLSQKSENSSGIASRVWEKDGVAFSLGNDANPFSNIQGTIINLTVGDNIGRSASQQYDVKTQLSIPQWQEISPF